MGPYVYKLYNFYEVKYILLIFENIFLVVSTLYNFMKDKQ